MAKPHTCCNPRRNPLPGGKNKLVGGPPGAPTKGSNIPTHSSTVSRALTFAPPSTNELFKRSMKAYLEPYQKPSQPPAKYKRPFKAKVPDVYYGKLYMDRYHFS